MAALLTSPHRLFRPRQVVKSLGVVDSNPAQEKDLWLCRTYAATSWPDQKRPFAAHRIKCYAALEEADPAHATAFSAKRRPHRLTSDGSGESAGAPTRQADGNDFEETAVSDLPQFDKEYYKYYPRGTDRELAQTPSSRSLTPGPTTTNLSIPAPVRLWSEFSQYRPGIEGAVPKEIGYVGTKDAEDVALRCHRLTATGRPALLLLKPTETISRPPQAIRIWGAESMRCPVCLSSWPFGRCWGIRRHRLAQPLTPHGRRPSSCAARSPRPAAYFPARAEPSQEGSKTSSTARQALHRSSSPSTQGGVSLTGAGTSPLSRSTSSHSGSYSSPNTSAPRIESSRPASFTCAATLPLGAGASHPGRFRG